MSGPSSSPASVSAVTLASDFSVVSRASRALRSSRAFCES